MSSTTPTLSAVENEIVDIQREMRHIEGTVERPPTPPHHTDLSHRSDATASTTHRIPMEILSLIFQYSSPSLPPFMDVYGTNRNFHLTLRLVSSRWHYIVQSTPQLWARITSLTKYVHEDFARYIQLCLDNSGRLPLIIRLTFPISQSDSPYLVSPLVDDALRCNLYRIRILELHDARISWLTEIPAMFELTFLQLAGMSANKLGTGASLTIPLNLNLCKNSKINYLFLAFIAIDVKLGPSPSLITRLDLESIPIDTCIRLYLECPHVKDFQCSSPRDPQSPTVPKIPTHTLKRDSLSSLAWDLLMGDLAHWNDYVLEWTHFPALKTLLWKDRRYPDSEYDTTEFFSRLPQSLDRISFSYIRSSAIFLETPIDHIRPDAHVSDIAFYACSEKFLNNVFQSLFKKTTAGGEEVIPFPRLVCVSAIIYTVAVRHPFSSVVGKNLVQLLEERKNIITKFTFRYSSDFNDLDSWEAETWRRLDKLRDGGLTINILGL